MASKLFIPFSCILFLASFIQPIVSHLQDLHLPPNGLSGNDTNPSPFGFLNTMQVCRKGETVKGIRDLKLYLAKFGYLKYNKNPNADDLEEDHFDEDLEGALKSYQVYFHLNVTGRLDGPTVSQMLMPRCGFPDKKSHQHTNNSLHTVSHYQLFDGRPKWPIDKTHLTYGFGSLFPTEFMPPVDRAFESWATASGYFTFSRAESYEGADLKISFQGRDHGDGSSFDGPGGVLAHAFSPTNGILHFDVEESWSIGAVQNAFDLETVALHEIGHLLGLGHSEMQNAIMWPTTMAEETKGLDSDDIQGLNDLYDI